MHRRIREARCKNIAEYMDDGPAWSPLWPTVKRLFNEAFEDGCEFNSKKLVASCGPKIGGENLLVRVILNTDKPSLYRLILLDTSTGKEEPEAYWKGYSAEELEVDWEDLLDEIEEITGIHY